jgi:hypothetical protein
VAWVLDHQRDLDADFRVFYHLSWREALALPGPELLALAYRVGAYPGVIYHRLAEAEAKERRSTPRGARMVPGERSAIMADPMLSQAISFN